MTTEKIEPLTAKEFEQMMKYREKNGKIPEFVLEKIRASKAKKTKSTKEKHGMPEWLKLKLSKEKAKKPAKTYKRSMR